MGRQSHYAVEFMTDEQLLTAIGRQLAHARRDCSDGESRERIDRVLMHAGELLRELCQRRAQQQLRL